MEAPHLVSSLDDFRKFVTGSFDSIPSNLLVADLACGNGWAGKRLIERNAKFIDFLDIRQEWFNEINPDLDFSNYKFHLCDIENTVTLLEKIINANVILYFGHLYHSINPTAILDTICKSGASYLVLESKINDATVSDLDEPKILKHYEDSEHYYNAWSASPSTIEVCQPTFSFTKNFLEDAGWTIVDSYNFAEDIILPSQLPKPALEDNKQMQRFAFYAVR